MSKQTLNGTFLFMLAIVEAPRPSKTPSVKDDLLAVLPTLPIINQYPRRVGNTEFSLIVIECLFTMLLL